MPKIKNIAVPAAFGFVLSFLVSLLCTHHLGFSVLRGLIFCLIFGVLAFIIDFVYGKFLDDGAVSDSLQDTSSVKNDSSRSGARVDITIDDADLSNDGKELSFAVNRNRFKLADADTQDLRENDVMFAAESSEKKNSDSSVVSSLGNSNSDSNSLANSSQSNVSSFKPVPLGQPVQEVKQSSAVSKPSETKSATNPQNAENHSAGKKENSSNNEIKALPDLDSFDNSDDNSADSSNGADEISGSSSDDSVSVPVPGAGGKQTVQQDTETLAKAIRTVLKRDEQ